MRATFAVCQLGARMHYAVPRLLASSGNLEMLFTDICAAKGWPRWLRAMPESWQPPGLRRLLGRVPRGIPAARIVAFNGLGLEYSRRRSAARTPTESTAVHLWAGTKFCELIIRAGLGMAAGVYAFNTAALELLAFARSRGLKTALEQTIAPTEIESRLLAREFAAHPDWEPAAAQNAHEAELAGRERAEWEHADLIFCGSEFVRQGIAECGGPAERCVVVPYGVDTGFAAAPRPPHDGPLRVLTVGAVGLRKGSPYVLAAARALRGHATFRIVGATASLSPQTRERIRADLELCGAVPRAEIFRHYEWADVFLLPSVCEGSATATYEALAAGLPVIATPNTGAHLTESASGFTVPVGDANAIVEKLTALSANRPLLREMSAAAREQSRALAFEAYGRRLIEALTTLTEARVPA
jgi:glycosyltransferase involved in cell wall biosynthesis